MTRDSGDRSPLHRAAFHGVVKRRVTFLITPYPRATTLGVSIGCALRAVLATTAGLLFLTFGAHPATAATDLIQDCSDDSYVLRIKDITFTPPFPEPGKQ